MRDRRTIVLDEDVAEELGLRPGERLEVRREGDVIVLLEEGDWVEKLVRRFEERYGMPTEEFLEAWRRGEIPEPEDPDLLADFMEWEVLGELRRRRGACRGSRG
ncbi:hypothetical protein PABY_19510 [Pyrodictium abyssi]|uniref:SpoVT-AbrB domain-containing protein n=1 Tax=Pyrodictium abyssi TaxID=54256 RepID=A0ABN6ZQ86_9CREN|nr:hypothetical protein PABY_19510 [Pyrodictium abyssi]